MGSKNIIWMMFYAYLTPLLIIRGTLANKESDPRSLDEFLHVYAQKIVKWPRTGAFYNIPLHSNYSGMQISYVQINTASLWTSGINSSFIHIPPKTRIRPFVQRLDIVFHHLGNLSSFYFTLPRHRFLTPVIGFTAYNGDRNASAANHGSVHKLKLEGNNTILVQFQESSVKRGENGSKKCVTFHPNGRVEYSSVISSNRCRVRGQGHFCIVVRRAKPFWEKRATKCWAIGLGVGIGVLFFAILAGILLCNFARKKQVKGMQRESEQSEALDTVWVGGTKMPAAGGIRTQPVLENDFLP